MKIEFNLNNELNMKEGIPYIAQIIEEGSKRINEYAILTLKGSYYHVIYDDYSTHIFYLNVDIINTFKIIKPVESSIIS